jgi:DNA repair protein RadA/Sms
MAKEKIQFQCQQCGYVSPKWLGRCPDCDVWNSFKEETALKFHSSKSSEGAKGSHAQAYLINEVSTDNKDRIITGISEFDRVMGGGITQGSLTLIGGEPGIGKSTLLMEVCGKISKLFSDEKILYVSGEESEAQVASRAKRLGVDVRNFYVYHQNVWEKIRDELNRLSPKFLVVDSIQTTISSELPSAGGTVSQVREVTFELMNYTKGHNLTAFAIGHVTKDGAISGPKLLEHMVDTVVYFEGEQQHYYRLLRAIKNRFGNTNEVGIFEMQEDGLKEVKNPSGYFLDQSFKGAYGRAITCLLEGTRPLLVEIQALVTENKFGTGRRTTQGIDHNRVSMLVAVIEKYFELPFSFCDIYVNVVGGMKLEGRDADLAVVAALISSYQKKPLLEKAIFLGEVGLTGEVRPVSMLETRLKECAKLGYEHVVVSEKALEKIKSADAKISTRGIRKIQEILKECY